MLETLLNLDGGFLLFLQENVRNPMLNTIMIFITSLGDGGFIWIAATIALLIPKKTRKVGVMSAVALLGSLLINNNIIKNLVQRPRPFVTFTDIQILIPTPSEFSFPSGHTASAAMFFPIMFLPLYIEKFNNKKGIALCIIFPIVATLIVALSRIVVGAHYMSDVLVGGTMTLVSSIFALKITNLIFKKAQKNG